MFSIIPANNKSIFPVFSQIPQFELSTLEEKGLRGFFEANDALKSQRLAEIKSPTPSKSTDFIHFIWMGNPIKNSDEETILSWKKEYPSQQIILWTDKKALESNKIKDFALKHNIILIDLEEIFSDHNTFGLNEFIKLEKNRLPPNWGAISDIYRYLIMYYFGGTYSDTDSKINYDDTKLDFDNDFAFYKINTCKFVNDRLMTKNIRQDFWIKVFDEIKNKYKSDYNFKYSIRSRCNCTLERTGPDFFINCIFNYIDFDKNKIQDLDYKIYSNYSWKGNLTNEKCEKLAKENNIITRIVSNIMVDLKETKSLNLQKYDKIIAKIPKIERKDILNRVENELKNLNKKNIIVQNIIAQSPEEYDKFLNILKERELMPSCIDKKNIYKALIKAAKRKNVDMFKYLFNKYPDDLFPIDEKMIKLIINLDNKEILLSVLDYATKNDKKMDFYNYSNSYLYIDIDLALQFFKQIQRYAPDFLQDYKKCLPKAIHSILFPLFCPRNEDNLDKFEELLNIVPFEMLTQKSNSGKNILDMILSINFWEVIPVIYKVIITKYTNLFWSDLTSTLSHEQLDKINVVIENAGPQITSAV